MLLNVFHNNMNIAEIIRLWYAYNFQILKLKKGEENAKIKNTQIGSKTLQSNSFRKNYEKTSRYRSLAPTQILIKKTQNFQDGRSFRITHSTGIQRVTIQEVFKIGA